MAHRWYVVHAYSGFENKVAASIREQAEKKGLSEEISQVMVPTEEVVEVRRGSKVQTERKFFPGYVLVQMDMDNDTWHMVKDVPKVLGFIGGTTDHPAPITDREADAIFLDELRAADLYDGVSQAFAVYLPVKSVGVVGDARRYADVIALRAVETVDFMTARWAHLPYDFIERVSNRIINEISGVSRVVYDVSSKPPATIEWE